MNLSKMRIVFAAALIAASFSANAGVIVNGSALTKYDNFENFDQGTAKSNLSGDFGTTGLSFNTLGAGGISLITNGRTSCSFGSRGMTGNFLGMGLDAPCTPNASVLNSVSMLFAQDVAELSWLGFNFTSGKDGAGIVIQAYNDGKAVDSLKLTFDQTNRFNNQVVQFTGANFDELRFTETGPSQGYFGIDNMAWTNATVETPNGDVPEPSIALLMGVGAIGMVAQRRKAKKA